MQGSGDRGRKEGGRLSGERALRVPPCCSFPVSHSGGPHVVSFVVGRRPCVHGACVRAGAARRAAERKREKCRPKKDKSPRQGKCCVRAARLGSAIAASFLCVRSDPSDSSPVQGAPVTTTLCRGGKCRCVGVRKLLRCAGSGVRRRGCGHLCMREQQR